MSGRVGPGAQRLQLRSRDGVQHERQFDNA
jgi:hypothetical protein